MNAGIPKQFMVLSNKPVLMHTIERFHAAIPGIQLIVVLPAVEIDAWKKLCAENHFAIPHEIVAGGQTRFDSVKNGLEKTGDDSVVAVHDGVRPFASAALIQKCFSEAALFGNAVPSVPIPHTLRELKDEASIPVDRNNYVIIQTPQCFNSSDLKKAYRQAYTDRFTDDATVVEASGKKIHLVKGEEWNIKLTNPADFTIAEALAKNQSA